MSFPFLQTLDLALHSIEKRWTHIAQLYNNSARNQGGPKRESQDRSANRKSV